MVDYKAQADDFAASLPDRPRTPPTPDRETVLNKLVARYPILTEGVTQRSLAVKKKYGDGYSLTYQSLNDSNEDLRSPKFFAQVDVIRESKSVGIVPIIIENDRISFGGKGCEQWDDAAQKRALDNAVRPFFE